MIRTRNLESGLESESILFSLKRIRILLALNPNLDPNQAQKALDPDSKPNPDSHTTDLNARGALSVNDFIIDIRPQINFWKPKINNGHHMLHS